MYNIFRKYEINSKLNQYKSILNEIKKNDLSSLTLDELKEKYENKTTEPINSRSSIVYFFSIIRELINKSYNIKVYDEQILGAIALLQGNITEMKTGEGKTIVALFPAIYNAVYNKSVHIVTANDYLAKRDYEFSKKIFNFLSIELGIVLESDDVNSRINSYKSKVIYSTAKNLCFDYLHDNLIKSKSEQFNYHREIAIIDEIDFILIEEARTPIAISGKDDKTPDLSILFNENIKLFRLNEEFMIDDKSKNIELSEKGYKCLEGLLLDNELIKSNFDLYKYENLKYLQMLYQTIKANYVLKKDVDYIIKDNTVIIIDENTGRVLPGRRWSDGLHQAVEIKENVSIKKESKTLASSTLQGYFSKYEKICGMTGTARTEEVEFKEIYNLDIIPIATHKPMVRNDMEDVLYSKKEYMAKAVIKDVLEKLKLERPVLIGTTNVKDSEYLYEIMQNNNINCFILNAKNHENEASIIENAGKRSHVTISTNMAGRGTDIMLGGNKEVEIKKFMDDGLNYEDSLLKWQKENEYINSQGGLHVIGFSRSHSRRLDNQLIGRSGRQGDNGSSIFYLSLEDELLKVFGKSIVFLWNTLASGVQTVGISDRRVSKQILEAQKRNENLNFNVRKNLLKYSEIIEKQSDIIAGLRLSILDSTNMDNFIEKCFKHSIDYILDSYTDLDLIENNIEIIKSDLKDKIGVDIDLAIDTSSISELKTIIVEYITSSYNNKKEYFEDKNLNFEKSIILGIIDNIWTEHLTGLDNIRKGTSYRRYAQKDPFDEFKTEAFKMFKVLINQIYLDITSACNSFDPIDLINKLDYNSNNFITKNNVSKNLFLYDIGMAGF